MLPQQEPQQIPHPCRKRCDFLDPEGFRRFEQVEELLFVSLLIWADFRACTLHESDIRKFPQRYENIFCGQYFLLLGEGCGFGDQQPDTRRRSQSKGEPRMTKDTISSARRALRVLKALKGHVVTGISNKALEEALGESSVNICRALKELQAEGLAVKLDDGRWAHSVAMLQIARAYTDHMDSLQSRMTEINQRVAAGAMG